MNKNITFVIGVIVVLVLGFFAFNSYIYNRKQQGPKMDTQQTAQAETSENGIKVAPISHATMVLTLAGQVIYSDPVGGANAFNGQPEANIVVVTDIHSDHLNADTLTAVVKPTTILVVPPAVYDMLPQALQTQATVMKNGEKITQKGIEIEAIPMYNIPESPTAPHTKGRGNGYVLTGDAMRVYIVGDTSATPEMKALKNIDVAFIPMNLPYTMSVEEAAEGVLAFKPKVVHPYHYRNADGFSDVNKFKQLVESKDPDIKVELLNFYPGGA